MNYREYLADASARNTKAATIKEIVFAFGTIIFLLFWAMSFS